MSKDATIQAMAMLAMLAISTLFHTRCLVCISFLDKGLKGAVMATMPRSPRSPSSAEDDKKLWGGGMRCVSSNPGQRVTPFRSPMRANRSSAAKAARHGPKAWAAPPAKRVCIGVNVRGSGGSAPSRGFASPFRARSGEPN